MHLDRPWLFADSNLKTYSEADYKYKFWSFVFETYLGRTENMVLRWRDTMFSSYKKASKKFRLDLRLVVVAGEEEIDGCTGEMARKATVKKVYKDKLKSTVASKCHLNTLLKSMPFLRPQDVATVKMPIIQIAGFSGKLSVLSLAKKKQYQLEDVSSFCFPRSLQQIQSGSLENLVDVLATIDEMLCNLRKFFNDNNNIEDILGETS